MDSYEFLLIEAEKRNLIVKELPLRGNDGRIKGKRIAINQTLTTPEKLCTLEEEIAHFDLNAGVILDQWQTSNRKQEHKARMLAVTRRVGLWDIVGALRKGYHSLAEIAEYMGITEGFLAAAIDGYRKKYGLYVRVGNDTLLLEPTVALLSQIQ